MPPPPDRNVFQMPCAPRPGDIDERGHVNNAVYVRWLQDVATAHWVKLSSPADVARYLWVETRHEIDSHQAILPAETVTARKWVGVPSGARFDRFVEFVDVQGRISAAARKTRSTICRKLAKPDRRHAGCAVLVLGYDR